MVTPNIGILNLTVFFFFFVLFIVCNVLEVRINFDVELVKSGLHLLA